MPKGTALLILASFSLTLFVFGPGTVYLTNSNEFINTYQDLLLLGIILALAFSVILAALLFGLKAGGAALYEKSLALIFASGLLLWLQGNFLLREYGPLDGRAIPWSKMARFGYLDGAIWLGGLAAAVILSRFVVRNARTVCLFLLIIQLGYAAVLWSQNPQSANFKKYSISVADQFLFSKGRNVIILVLDAFQTDFFEEIIRESSEMARKFEGFTYFRNGVGGYPFTELSVALMLTGRYYDNLQPFERWLKEAYEGHSIPRVLKANDWRVDLFPQISYSAYYSDEIGSNFVKGIPFPERLNHVAYAVDLGLFRSLPHLLKPYIYDHRGQLVSQVLARFLEISPRRTDDAMRKTDVPNTRGRRKTRRLFPIASFRKSQDVRFVDAMYSESRLGSDEGAFKFFHLTGPHIPLILDENLRYIPMEVSRSNYKKAATASLKLTSLFLKGLRQLGIYDESLIFIVGDHGAASQGQKFVLQPGMPMDPKGEVVTEFYRINALPLILVKPFAASGDLKTSDAPVSLSDVPATVFSALGLAVDAPGESMFTVDAAAPRERRFLMYKGRDVYSYFGMMEEFLVASPAWADGAWRRSGRKFSKGRMVVKQSAQRVSPS